MMREDFSICTAFIPFYSSKSFLVQVKIWSLTEAFPTLIITFMESLHHMISVKNEKHVINGLINNDLLVSTRITFLPISVDG